MTYAEAAEMPQFITSCPWFAQMEDDDTMVKSCFCKRAKTEITSCDNCPLNGGVK